MATASFNRWVAPAIDKFGFLACGILWLILVIFAEYYYRQSLLKRRLWQSFFLVAWVELLFLFLAHIMPFLVNGLKGLNWFSLLVIGGEGGGIVLLFFAFSLLHQKKINKEKL